MGKRGAAASEQAHDERLINIDANCKYNGRQSDVEDIPIEFDYCDLNPTDDFDILKRMIIQTLDVDFTHINISELADLLLEQRTSAGIGSCIKADGDGDDGVVVAYTSVLNLKQHADKPVVQSIVRYILGRAAASSSPSLGPALTEILSPASSANVGLICSDRMINLPTTLMGDLYHFLSSEIDTAATNFDANPASFTPASTSTSTSASTPNPYRFSHFIVLSRAYTLHQSSLDTDSGPSAKKKKKDSTAAAGGADSTTAGLMYFHTEDELFRNDAVAFGDYEFQNPRDEGAIDAKRAFSNEATRSRGHLMVMEADKFKESYLSVFREYMQSLEQ